MSIADPSQLWRNLPWTVRDTASVMAAMMVWARLIPETPNAGKSEAGVFGFFDEQHELTLRASSAILLALGNQRRDHNDQWAFDDLEKKVGWAEPGILESLRQSLRKFIVTGDHELSLERTRQCAEALVEELSGEDANLPKLIIGVLRPDKHDTVYCGFDLTAPVALELAKQHRVYLQLPNVELAQVIALLAIAGDYSLQVSPTHPIKTQNDADGITPWRDDRPSGGTILRSFEHAVALPPFGAKYPTDDPNPKFGSVSMADSLHISLVLARGAKRKAILLPDGFLFRTAKNDQSWKRSLISSYGLAAVISLPRGIIGHDSGVMSSLLIFDASNAPRESVRFVDCRSNWPSKSKLLSPQVLENQTRMWIERAVSDLNDKYVATVGLDELADNDFNLLVDRYVIAPEIRRQRQLLNRQETIPLDDLADLYRPQVFKPTPEQLRPPIGQIITMREVATGDIRDGVVEYPQKEIDVWAGDVDQIERIILRPGDIVISIKGKVGVAGVVPDDAPDDIFGAWTAGQSFVIARLRKSTAIDSPAVLARYLASRIGQTQLQALAGGTTVPSIQMADLRRLAIPVPTIETQRKIMDQVEQIKAMRARIRQIQSDISEREQELSKMFLGDDGDHGR